MIRSVGDSVDGSTTEIGSAVLLIIVNDGWSVVFLFGCATVADSNLIAITFIIVLIIILLIFREYIRAFIVVIVIIGHVTFRIAVMVSTISGGGLAFFSIVLWLVAWS